MTTPLIILADLLSASESFTTHELNLEVLFKFSLSLIFFRTLHADQHHTAARQSYCSLRVRRR